MKCPICNGTGDLPAVDLRLHENSLYYNNQQLILTPREAEILSVVISRGPVDTDRLVMGVYGHLEPEDAVNTIRVMSTRLRRKLSPLGLYLVNVMPLGHGSKASYMLTANSQLSLERYRRPINTSQEA